MGFQRPQTLKALISQTFVVYVRTSSTVVIAVVFRLLLDCIGIIITHQSPGKVGFWFAHCHGDGTCVFSGVVLYFASLILCTLFSWSCHGWITDHNKNPYTKVYSFAIIVDAANCWIPMQVVIGKTNAAVEWFMNTSRGDVMQVLLSSIVTVLLTSCCALLTHSAMKYCDAIAHARVTRGVAGFGKTLILNFLHSLAWAAGWSGWHMVLSFMVALETKHHKNLVPVVMCACLFLTTSFYLTYGPEPIIPDPNLQRHCYSGGGYSKSMRRSFMSYFTQQCIIFTIMCCCDADYGILYTLAQFIYPSFGSTYDIKALPVHCWLACTITFIFALLSAMITWTTNVGSESSSRLSLSISTERLIPSGGQRMEMEDYHAADDWSYEDDRSSSTYPCRDTSGHLEMKSTPEVSVDGTIPKTVRASVLIYNVAGLVVCGQWGAIAMRAYTLFFGYMASYNNTFYILTVLIYATAMTVSMSYFVRTFFPSSAELCCVEESLGLSPKESFNHYAPLIDSEPMIALSG